MAVTLAMAVSVFFLRHVRLCSFHMSFMQALEQMYLVFENYSIHHCHFQIQSTHSGL